MAAPSEVRKRKMVPKVTPPPTPEFGMDNEFVDLEIGGEEGATTPGSSPKAPNNNLQSNHVKKNGSGPKRWTTDFQHYKETSLTEPLLAGESETASDEEVNALIERDTSESDHVSEFIVKTDDEASWQIALQVFLPYIVAGLGMVGAGLVLDKVQHWVVFKEVSEIFILVPALLGLKGNLEMTLASRLSTQANLGNMDSSKEQWKMIGGNLALTQAQAIVVGFLASIFAMVFGWIPKGKFVLSHAFLLSASSVLTAAIASFILGSIMVLVVVLSRKFRINPDNVATPIAASLGDLTTLALLSSISALLWNAIESHPWLAVVLLVIFLGLMPLWCFISHKNKYTYDVLYSGWVPIIIAMVISSVGGLILDATVAAYDGIAVFQPVINGVGGNLVAVQASRLSTSLHMTSTPGKLPKNAVHGCANPITTFFGKDIKARTARVLMLMVIPGQIIFLVVINLLDAGHTSLTPVFTVGYLTAAVIQVALLLYIANWMVHLLWKKGDDPDNFSIPYLTAMGDLLGTGLLALTFQILQPNLRTQPVVTPTVTLSMNSSVTPSVTLPG